MGVNEEITGGTGSVIMFRRTETVLTPLFVTTISGLVSPSRSHKAILDEFASVGKSTRGAKVPEVIKPGVLVFLNIEAPVLLKFETVISGFPSPFRSPIETPEGVVPANVVKSTFAGNQVAGMEPDVLAFRKTDMVRSRAFITTRSGLLSPSMSPIIASTGLFPDEKVATSMNEPAVIEPEILVFLNALMVLSDPLVTTISG